jgi:predicted ribonuclease YlaK
LKRVLLVSNDINLRNKAFISDIKAMNWSEFYEQFSGDSQVLDSNSDEEEPKSKRMAKSWPQSQTSDNSLPFRYGSHFVHIVKHLILSLFSSYFISCA